MDVKKKKLVSDRKRIKQRYNGFVGLFILGKSLIYNMYVAFYISDISEGNSLSHTHTKTHTYIQKTICI